MLQLKKRLYKLKLNTLGRTFDIVSVVWGRPVSCLHWTQLVMAVSEQGKTDSRIWHRARNTRSKKDKANLKPEAENPPSNIRKILELCSGSTEADAIRS